MEQISLERSIWIGAPRERVWQAVAEPEQLAQWFVPRELGAQLTLDASGRLCLHMGPMEATIARHEAMEPPRQLTSRGLPDDLLATTFRLDEEDSGTRVTVTMTGFDALPQQAARERLGPSGAAWEKALQNLKAYVEGADLPFAGGFVAALYGYRREASRKVAVERSIWIAAPRERVWAAISDPEQIEQWYSPGTPWRVSALEVGGKLSVYDPQTDSHSYIQTIEVFDPPHHLVTLSAPEPPEPAYETAYMLTEENGGTRLTLTYASYETAPDDGVYYHMEQAAFGFGMMMLNLRAYVDGQGLPYPAGF